MTDAGGDYFRAKCFEEPTPPAWREDEVSAILDATGGRLDGSAGDVWVHLQAQWEKSIQAELVACGIDRFNLEAKARGAALLLSRHLLLDVPPGADLETTANPAE